jgi:hypothetical protein
MKVSYDEHCCQHDTKCVENRMLRTRIFSVLSIPSHSFSDAVWLCHRHLFLRSLYLTPSPSAAILAIHPILHPLLN